MYALGLRYFIVRVRIENCTIGLPNTSAVLRLLSALRTATSAFDVRSSGLFCSRPGGLELATRLPARSVKFRQFSPGPENIFFSRFASVHSALEALQIVRYINLPLTLTLTLTPFISSTTQRELREETADKSAFTFALHSDDTSTHCLIR